MTRPSAKIRMSTKINGMMFSQTEETIVQTEIIKVIDALILDFIPPEDLFIKTSPKEDYSIQINGTAYSWLCLQCGQLYLDNMIENGISSYRGYTIEVIRGTEAWKEKKMSREVKIKKWKCGKYDIIAEEGKPLRIFDYESDAFLSDRLEVDKELVHEFIDTLSEVKKFYNGYKRNNNM